MSFLGVPTTMNQRPPLKTSNAQSYRPGDFLKRLDTQKDSKISYISPNGINQNSFFDKSLIIGLNGLNSYSDDFYKSQVMDRTIGGQPVIMNTMNNYQPMSADNPQIMDQIRQQHVKIMDEKLQEAIISNGGNAMQQVKTIIVEPLSEVLQIKQSNVNQGFYGVSQQPFLSTTPVFPVPSNKVSNLTIKGGHSRASSIKEMTTPQKNKSRIQYVPYQRKITQFETRQRIQRIPRQKTIIEYDERIITQQVPVQKTVVDYYAIQHVTQYQPKLIQQTIIEMVPVEKTYNTTNYIPIQQKIIHLPSQHGIVQNKNIASRLQIIPGEALKPSQSRISYKPPIIQEISRISLQNSFINALTGEKSNRTFSQAPNRISRISRISPLKYLNNITQRSISPINVRSSKNHQQNMFVTSNLPRQLSANKFQSTKLPFPKLKQVSSTSNFHLSKPPLSNKKKSNLPLPSSHSRIYQIPNVQNTKQVHFPDKS